MCHRSQTVCLCGCLGWVRTSCQWSCRCPVHFHTVTMTSVYCRRYVQYVSLTDCRVFMQAAAASRLVWHLKLHCVCDCDWSTWSSNVWRRWKLHTKTVCSSWCSCASTTTSVYQTIVINKKRVQQVRVLGYVGYRLSDYWCVSQISAVLVESGCLVSCHLWALPATSPACWQADINVLFLLACFCYYICCHCNSCGFQALLL